MDPGHRKLELWQRCTDEEPDLYGVAALVATIPDVAAAVVRFANSSYVGAVYPVGSVLDAVIRIGSRQVGAIAMASANRDLVETWGVPELWEDGLASGRAAKFIGRLMGLGRREAENLFVAGLFSSAGAAALASDDPGYLAWRAKQWSKGVSESQLLSRERMAFQSDHVTAAGRILESWNMPTMIVDAVASHHSPVTTFQKAVAAGMAVTDPFSPARCLDTSFPAAMRRLDLAAHTNSVSSEALRYVDALSPAGDRLLAGI